MKSGKKGKNVAALVIAAVLAAAGYVNYDDIIDILELGESPTQGIAETVATGDMRTTFLDVGQGDCTIIRTEGRNMVIDTGNNDQGDYVVNYLKENGITDLDYLILTHPDADHIGGADNVLENIDVETVIMPDVANDTMTYKEVIEDIDRYQVEVVYPNVGDIFTLGDAEFTILCPEEELVDQSDLNGSSVGIKLVHGKNSFVMCGDAEEKSELAMVKRFGSDLECDVLKCGHHGSSTATCDEFLKATNPTWALISCGQDNQYGHPHLEVLEKLRNDDVQVYRTDEMGTIIAVSDGENI
ncbi:ComEC/Rec2 family competence protein, partial [Bariatricus sp. SGI.154]|uniref:ComEC/Rec2 family competence protein n=1 Tax=Bariatricus sp. SGI.154 TaxID=3420549 RepID=UPI003D04B0D6